MNNQQGTGINMGLTADTSELGAKEAEKLAEEGGYPKVAKAMKFGGYAAKGLGVANDFYEAHEFGQQTYQEAKDKGYSDEDARDIADRATANYVNMYRLPAFAAKSLLAPIPALGAGGVIADAFLQHSYGDNIKQWLGEKSYSDHKRDKDNGVLAPWKRTPDAM